jgi:hypothetical protein
VPRIVMKMDNLNERNPEFAQAPLRQPIFLNSVPKCGTHLIRNVMRMFVPVEQQYHALFVQHPSLRQHGPIAFAPSKPMLSWGHLLYSDDAANLLRPVRSILMVRDPYDWVLARARFFMSENFQGVTDASLKGGRLDTNDLLNLMIFGIHGKAPTLEEIFRFNAVCWLGTKTYLVRYEEMVGHLKRLETRQAELYFAGLFDACGIDIPADWRERVLVGSDRKQSATARENLEGAVELPDELPDMQKRLVDYAAPGLRALLGYA